VCEHLHGKQNRPSDETVLKEIVLKRKKYHTRGKQDDRQAKMEYNDIRDAVLFAEERAEKRGISIGEKRNRTEFAIKCYRKGMSIAEIADLTDLSVGEVKEVIGKLS
jgi:predicted transposase/invertase (TIGR01784 family)